MSKPTIAFDLDGVIADWFKKYRAFAERTFDIKLPFPRCYRATDWKLTPSQKQYLKHWVDLENFHTDLDVVPGFDIEYLHTLAYNANLVFVTARYETVGMSAHDQSTGWLEARKIVDPTVIVTKYKGPVIRALHPLVYVDDCVDVLKEIHFHLRADDRTCMSTRLLLYPQRYNEAYDKIPHIQRVTDFQHMKVVINEALKHNALPIYR